MQTLIILMMVFPSRRSNKVYYDHFIYVCPDLNFPEFPKPNNNCLPLDADGKQVRDMETEIVNVLMPYWYWNLLIDYKVSNDDVKIRYEAFKSKMKELQKEQE